MKVMGELNRLREENKRFISLLNQHGIAWKEKLEASPSLETSANLPVGGLSIKRGFNYQVQL